MIDYISDIHIDSWEEKLNLPIDKIVKAIFSNKSSDTLVIAGDLARTPTKVFEALKVIENLKYKKIIYTLGNNEFYTDKKIPMTTKFFLYKTITNSLNRVTLLNNQCTNIDGLIVYGATPFFIDTSYINKNLKNIPKEKAKETLKTEFESTKGNNYLTLPELTFWHEKQIQKMKKMPNVDIVVTHYKPLFEDKFFSKDYKQNPKNELTCFNGSFIFPKTKKYIYGHTHQIINFDHQDTSFFSNAIGKPGDNFNNLKELKGLLKTIQPES